MSFDDVEKDTTLLNRFEEYLYSNNLDIYMKGERIYGSQRYAIRTRFDKYSNPGRIGHNG